MVESYCSNRNLGSCRGYTRCPERIVTPSRCNDSGRINHCISYALVAISGKTMKPLYIKSIVVAGLIGAVLMYLVGTDPVKPPAFATGEALGWGFGLGVGIQIGVRLTGVS